MGNGAPQRSQPTTCGTRLTNRPSATDAHAGLGSRGSLSVQKSELYTHASSILLVLGAVPLVATTMYLLLVGKVELEEPRGRTDLDASHALAHTFSSRP